MYVMKKIFSISNMRTKCHSEIICHNLDHQGQSAHHMTPNTAGTATHKAEIMYSTLVSLVDPVDNE